MSQRESRQPMNTGAGEPADQADRRRHPGFARHESLAVSRVGTAHRGRAPWRPPTGPHERWAVPTLRILTTITTSLQSRGAEARIATRHRALPTGLLGVGWALRTGPVPQRDPIPRYRRLYVPGGTVFLTVVTHERRPLFGQCPPYGYWKAVE